MIAIAAALTACGGGSVSATPTPVAARAPTGTAALSPQATPTAFFDLDSVTPPVPPAPSTSAAHGSCATPKPHASGDTNETLSSGGIDRTYILHVPPSYDGTEQTPLVLNLHGYGSTARQQAIYSQLPAEGDKNGFIVVSPDGTGEPRRWNYPGLPGADDIAFMRGLLDHLEGELCVDPGWVFSAGMSNGAAFSSFVACALPERITAIAPVAATVFPRTCTTDRAIPVISFRGTEDPCVPYEGGTSKCGQNLPVAAAEESMRTWAAHNGCLATPTDQRSTEHTRTLAYGGCRDDASVVLYVIEGGGHTWPGSIDVARLGATTHEINAADLIWQFFAAQASLRR